MDTQQHRVFLACPGNSFMWGAVEGILLNTRIKRDVKVCNSQVGWDDLNRAWLHGLNEFEAGNCTHFAMLHSDIAPEPGWVDTICDELDRLDADMISVPSPIKDHRGVTSCGIGNPTTRWAPWKRFTIRELATYPETFTAADVGFAGFPLLHNSGCWVADLRKPVFRQTNEQGMLRCVFNFPISAVRDPNGAWVNLRESEDWYFSRELFELGAKTYISRKVKLLHFSGGQGYANHGTWGTYENGDDETRINWDEEFKAKMTQAAEEERLRLEQEALARVQAPLTDLSPASDPALMTV